MSLAGIPARATPSRKAINRAADDWAQTNRQKLELCPVKSAISVRTGVRTSEVRTSELVAVGTHHHCDLNIGSITGWRRKATNFSLRLPPDRRQSNDIKAPIWDRRSHIRAHLHWRRPKLEHYPLQVASNRHYYSIQLIPFSASSYWPDVGRSLTVLGKEEERQSI